MLLEISFLIAVFRRMMSDNSVFSSSSYAEHVIWDFVADRRIPADDVGQLRFLQLLPLATAESLFVPEAVTVAKGLELPLERRSNQCSDMAARQGIFRPGTGQRAREA